MLQNQKFKFLESKKFWKLSSNICSEIYVQFHIIIQIFKLKVVLFGILEGVYWYLWNTPKWVGTFDNHYLTEKCQSSSLIIFFKITLVKSILCVNMSFWNLIKIFSQNWNDHFFSEKNTLQVLYNFAPEKPIKSSWKTFLDFFALKVLHSS